MIGSQFSDKKWSVIPDKIWLETPDANNEVANSRFQRSELDWLIYNDPLSYAELILNGDPEEYLRLVTETPQLDFD